MHSSYLACFNFECKDEVCWELKLTHLVVFAKVLTAMFIFLPVTYLRTAYNDRKIKTNETSLFNSLVFGKTFSVKICIKQKLVSWLALHIKGVFRTQSNIYKEAFCEIS